MAIDLQYVPLFTIEEVILDKDTGLPLAAGIVKFFRDSQRATPKPVFQISGSSPNYTFTDIGSELVLGLSGTFVDGNGDPMVPYAFPYDAAGKVDLYFVTVESSGNVAQFTREAVPYLAGTNIPSNQRSSTENELANPQFAEILFPSSGTTIINVTGSNTVTSIAPDWDIISSGTGTLTLQRLQPTAANIPTNPPYILSIAASAGLGSQVTLRQRMTNTPSIMRGGFASGSLIAAILSGGGSNVSMTYAPSTGTSTTVIPSTSIINDGAYHIIANNAAIPQQVNTAADTGYVDVLITIPTSRTIGISSIQLVGNAVSADIPFDEQTVERQIDHLFHYYKDSILIQPKDSLLVGWNFPLNPWQFTTKTRTTASNQIDYYADQTIVYQNNPSPSITIGASGINEQEGFAVSASDPSNRFIMIQYIDPASIRPYWQQKLSSMVSVYLNTAVNSQIPIKVRLIYNTALPNAISPTDPIMSWSGTDPVLASGWTAIECINDLAWTAQSGFNQFSFNGFQLPAASTDTMTLGIIVYTTSDMNSSGSFDSMVFQDISLVPNYFAIESNPLSFDQVLRQCEFYYEKTYENSVLPGTSSAILSQLTAQMLSRWDSNLGGEWQAYALPFGFEFRTIKRANPNLTFYSSNTGASGKVWINQFINGGTPGETDATVSTFWILANLGTKSFDYAALAQSGNGFFSPVPAGASTDFVNTTLNIQYVADCRLGVV